MLDSIKFISSNKEKKHYLKHNNEINDTRYRIFLSNLIEPLKDKISIDDMGLDYGCGYAPALADVLKKDGFTYSNITYVSFSCRVVVKWELHT